jgi:deoxyadenosine/deoxycytidine kinase|tara:strand:+ start:5672 stop:6235 length:564 start_codon:yes stop_codon:yes gene_type:complete
MKIVIDGLIGAGKSTQAELLSKVVNVPVITEPIHEWPLELFYSDPPRWGFMMQVAVLSSFAKFKDSTGIFERSPGSSRSVFWRNLAESKIVTEKENEVFGKMEACLSWDPDIMIYIDKTPGLCYDHIQARDQAGDGKITLEYLKTLQKYYIDFCKEKESITHIVDGNRSINEVHEDIIKIITVYNNQ